MDFAILGQGTAVPKQSFGVDEGIWFAEQAILDITEIQRKKIDVFYRHSGIERRSSVLLRGDEGSGRPAASIQRG